MEKKLIIFISTKYVEYGLFFLAMIFFAKSIGKVEYGTYTLVFTTISYAPFFLLGTNQLTLRNITIEKDKSIVIRQSFFLFITLLCFALLFSAFSTDRLHLTLLIIVALKVFNEYLMTLTRGFKKYNILSACYTATAIVWLLYLLFLDRAYFFYVWPVGLFISTLLLLISSNSFLIISGSQTKVKLRDMFVWINKGYKYAIIGLYLPVCTTIDRWFIDASKFGADLGVIQFSFNLSNIVSFGLGAFSFYYYPVYLEKISKRGSSFTKLKKNISKIQVGLLIITFLLLFLVQNIDLSIIGFGQYNGIYKYLWIYFPVRIFIWGFFPFNVLIDVRNKQSFYMKVVLILLFVEVIVFVLMNYIDLSLVLKYHPVVQLFSVLIFTLLLNLKSKKWL